MSMGPECEISDELAHGVRSFLEHFARLRPTDAVALMFRRNCVEAAAWIQSAIEAMCIPVRGHHVGHFDDARFAKELDELVARLHVEHPHASRVSVLLCELETISFSRPLRRKVLSANGAVAVTRVTNCIPALFEMAFTTTPQTQMRINAALLDQLRSSRRLRIRTDRGTDCTIDIDPVKYPWVSNYGIAGDAEINNLPGGEISIYPSVVNGTFVADGGINANVATAVDARLEHRPVRFEIRDGLVTSFETSDAELQTLFDFYFGQSHGRRVGELGIGTNIGIRQFVSLSSHLNERHPGVHLGFGSHNYVGTVDYITRFHIDAVSASTTIELENGLVIDTNHLTPGAVEHPRGMRSEDTESLPPAMRRSWLAR